MLWTVSDTHFGHANIIKYCSRPFSDVEEMKEALIERWNQAVGPLDSVIHVGDFALCKQVEAEAIFRRLNGRITLVRGNHDRWTRRAYTEIGFVDVVDQLWLDGVLFVHRPPEKIPPKALFAVHGHIHNSPGVGSRYENVSVEVVNYTPVSVSSLREKYVSNQ